MVGCGSARLGVFSEPRVLFLNSVCCFFSELRFFAELRLLVPVLALMLALVLVPVPALALPLPLALVVLVLVLVLLLGTVFIEK